MGENHFFWQRRTNRCRTNVSCPTSLLPYLRLLRSTTWLREVSWIPSKNQYHLFSLHSVSAGGRKKIHKFLFLIDTRESSPAVQIITDTNLGSFDPKKPTKVIIHGFTDRASNKWVIQMKDELLQLVRFLFLLVDLDSIGDRFHGYRRTQTSLPSTGLVEISFPMIKRWPTRSSLLLSPSNFCKKWSEAVPNQRKYI